MRLSGIVGSVVEAWAELRIHKTRILLALIGVALSVAALTTVVGLGNMVRESIAQGNEFQSGRPATLTVNVYPVGGAPEDPAELRAAFQAVAERYSVEYATVNQQSSLPFQFPDGVAQAQTSAVDSDYGVMRRVSLLEGSWFTEDDAQRLAPAVVVNEAFMTRLGVSGLTPGTTVDIRSNGRPVQAVVIGVRANTFDGEYPAAYLLADSYQRLGVAADGSLTGMELWVPEELAEPLRSAVSADLSAQFPNSQTEVHRSDYAAWGDPLGGLQLAVGGIAGLVMLLGAVGLLNISMVTVKYRVREIGIRRSFGATSGRIFLGVMLESVVATFVAGVLGVMIAVAVVKLPMVQRVVASGIAELPPFPLEAALLGLGTATAVGALAGLIPALVAVRVKVIDAIRY